MKCTPDRIGLIALLVNKYSYAMLSKYNLPKSNQKKTDLTDQADNEDADIIKDMPDLGIYFDPPITRRMYDKAESLRYKNKDFGSYAPPKKIIWRIDPRVGLTV